MRRRSGRRRIGLAISVLGIGALVVFLLRQSRGTAGEQIEKASETARSKAQEYVGSSEGDAEPQEEAERPADQEKGSVEEPGDATDEPARASEARSEEEDDTEETREELQRIVRESMRRSEKPSADRQGESVGEVDETERAGSGESTGEQVTVVGLLAKMREAFQETGGGQFILSSEEEGNFDLHGKEDKLDEVYQQQIQARVVGRIIDEDSQPRKMEVDEVEPA